MNNNTILIIDDEEEIVRLLTRMLMRKGFDVHAAHSLKEGWDRILWTQPDVVFMDVNLPDGNGLNKLKDIMNNFPSVKVVMISAFDMEDFRNQARENGAYTFLSKPFNLNQVSTLMDEIKKLHS